MGRSMLLGKIGLHMIMWITHNLEQCPTKTEAATFALLIETLSK